MLFSIFSLFERVALIGFLENNTFGFLSEGMGMNRGAWERFVRHTHLLNQKGFVRRFPVATTAAFVAGGNKFAEASPDMVANLTPHLKSGLVEMTDGGNLVYRTFASRMAAAIKGKDLDSIIRLGDERKGYVLRNLATVSNGVKKRDSRKFVNYVRGLLEDASPDVLFSLLSLDVNAKHRLIDVKGDTRLEAADYPEFISAIQEDARSVLWERFGFEGKVKVQRSLRDNIVPFLAKNADLPRGSTISFDGERYLYFFVHWVQQAHRRTDLDHSFTELDGDLNVGEVVGYWNQANSYIRSSGDITNAPAPKGATEYCCVDLTRVPAHVKYLVPSINVYSGDVFSENKEVYAGFFTSNANRFTLKRDLTRYDLSQPANYNMPFVIDIENRQVVILDYNSRDRDGRTSLSSTGEMKRLVSAARTTRFLSIGDLAEILSGDGDEVSLEINVGGKGDGQIAPEDLFSLFS